MARARWAAERARVDALRPEIEAHLAEIHAWNLPKAEGDLLGTLQWTEARTGKVRRWYVRIGDRVDRITVEAPGGNRSGSHGWTWFLAKLRACLSGNC